jgi:GNAT superfamily N-acetyltransferase
VFNWTVESFQKKHERSAFSCGQPTLDDFIRTRVSQYEKRRLGKTYVAIVPGNLQVIGYYTLSAGAVAFKQLPSKATQKLPKHPVPVVLLARLAVDQSFQGKRLGESLLLDALQRALDLSANLGIHAVEVDAVDLAAGAFYQKYGFIPLLDDPLHLYLPIKTVEIVLG